MENRREVFMAGAFQVDIVTESPVIKSQEGCVNRVFLSLRIAVGKADVQIMSNVIDDLKAFKYPSSRQSRSI